MERNCTTCKHNNEVEDDKCYWCWRRDTVYHTMFSKWKPKDDVPDINVGEIKEKQMIKIERVEADYVSCNCCHKRDINNIHIRFCSHHGRQGTIITLCEECAKGLRKLLTERYGEPEITHEQAIEIDRKAIEEECMKHYRQGREDEAALREGRLMQCFNPD